MKSIIIYVVSFLVVATMLVFITLFFAGCKSTIKVPEGLTEKCKYTWSLLIAYHEGAKNEGTKSGISILLKDAQTECFSSIDGKRIRAIAQKCRKEIYGSEKIDLRNLTKKNEFESCVRLYDGQIR